MASSAADVLILDLEDFTPPNLKDKARALTSSVIGEWRARRHVTAVRINALDYEADLAAAVPARPDIILYPMASWASEMKELDSAITAAEERAHLSVGQIEIVPVCETALGVAEVRGIVKGSPRINAALLGAEDLVADLLADRSREGTELEYARQRFLLECRAANIEPFDAPYTFSDIEGLSEEARRAKRLGYRAKSLIRPEHASPLQAILTPSVEDLKRAASIIQAFEAARSEGEDRALVHGRWVEVPAYRSAKRLLQQEGQTQNGRNIAQDD